MNLMEKLSSKKFFIFNLVLIGAIFGFSLAFLSFSCSTPQARAQDSAGVIPMDALAAARGMQNAFNAVAEKVLPSVVEIKTVSVQQRQTTQNPGLPWDFFFGPRRNGEDEDEEYRSQGLGSGVIVRKDKNVYYVLTNNHVVEGAKEIVLATRDGREYDAETVGTDSRRDLAIVKFETPDVFAPAELGDSDKVRVGDWAIAMGNPLGEQFSFSVTMGIVSAVGREGGPGGNISDFIQTDAPINQGNSGGPLVNIEGQVIGINTWIVSNNGGGSLGLGFAIPINNAQRAIDEIISTGRMNDGWLGVSLTDPSKDMLKALGLEGRRGALASQVFLGSPADKGGITPGDFVVAVNGKEIRSSTTLTQIVGDIRPGDKAEFTVIRDGAEKSFTVTIETRTDEVAAQNNKLWPGAYVMPLTDEIRQALKLDKSAQGGLVVVDVYAESPAAVIGMARGDRITAVNGTPVKDLPSFFKALREKTDKELWFTYIRGTNELESPRIKR